MGLERVLQDQKEKCENQKNSSNKSFEEKKADKTPAKKAEINSQDKNDCNKKSHNTIASRDPDHQKKIDRVKGLLNLK